MSPEGCHNFAFLGHFLILSNIYLNVRNNMIYNPFLLVVRTYLDDCNIKEIDEHVWLDDSLLQYSDYFTSHV